MILLECCCGRPVPPEPVGCVFNHPVVMSCLIWAVVVLVFGVLLFVYMIKKDKLKRKESNDVREQELNLKEKAFEKEKYWANVDELKSSTDEALKKQIERLNKEISDLKKEKDAKDILDKQLSIYKKILDELNVVVKPKENK